MENFKIKEILNICLKNKENFSLLIKNNQFYNTLNKYLKKDGLIKTKFLFISINDLYNGNNFYNDSLNTLDEIFFEENLTDLIKVYGKPIKIKRKSINAFYFEMENNVIAFLIYNFLNNFILESKKLKINIKFVDEEDFNNFKVKDNLLKKYLKKLNRKKNSKDYALFEKFEIKKNVNITEYFDKLKKYNSKIENNNNENIEKSNKQIENYFINNKFNKNFIINDTQNYNLVANFDTNNSNKFTCKYDIQIPNENSFQITKKIIGLKGVNMKNVIQWTFDQINYSEEKYGSKNDLIKLRLRGKGSGFKEGSDNKESEEDLHLCLSTRSYDIYLISCKLVEKLLNKIYKEYYHFCDKKSIKYEILSIMKYECFDSEKINFN